MIAVLLYSSVCYALLVKQCTSYFDCRVLGEMGTGPLKLTFFVMMHFLAQKMFFKRKKTARVVVCVYSRGKSPI